MKLLNFIYLASITSLHAATIGTPIIWNASCSSKAFNLGTNTCLVTGGGGGVSSVTASGPLASSGGTTPNISLTGIIPLANGGFGLSNTQTDITTTGTITALNPTTTILNFTGSIAKTLQGMVSNGTTQRVVIRNTGAGQLNIPHQSTGATAANRFDLAGAKTLPIVSGDEGEFVFNTTSSRWNLKELRAAIATDAAGNIVSLVSGNITGGSNLNLILGSLAVGSNGLSGGGENVILGYKTAYFLNGNPTDNIFMGHGAGGDDLSGASPSGSNNIVLGSAAGNRLTTAASNILIGANAGNNTTTGTASVFLGNGAGGNTTIGSNDVAMGAGAGIIHQTGDFNISIGQASGSASATNLSNTIAIGLQSRVTSSNQGNIGSGSTPVNIGINNNNAQYPLDVSGDANVSGSYRVNGVAQNPWILSGNNGTGGSGILGTLDFSGFQLYTNGLPLAVFTPEGLTGFQKATPSAIVHIGSLAGTIVDPASLFSIPQLTNGTGYTFGGGNKDYSEYAFISVSGTTVYSPTGVSATFTEPPTSDYDPASFSSVSQNGTGYDPSVDPIPTYQIWAIWVTGMVESLTPASATFGSWSDPVNAQEVVLTWTAPLSTFEAPTQYFIVRNGTDFQVTTNSTFTLTDQNSGWTAGSSPGLPSVSNYNVFLSGSAANGATGYRFLNTTLATFIDGGGPSLTDDDTWVTGSTVTPTTSNYDSLDMDGALNGNSGVFSSTLSASNLSGTNTGDVTIGTANGLSLSGQALSMAVSSPIATGTLSGTDWQTFNQKVSSSRTISTTSPILGGGDLSANRTISCQTASSFQSGCLSNSSFAAFSAKGSLSSGFMPLATGSLTAIVANEIIGAGKVGSAVTIENLEASAAGFTCVSNPTLTLLDCGTSPGACTSGTTTLGSVTLTAANTITDGTLSVTTLAAGHYWAWEITAGTCTALNAVGTAEYK